MKRTRTLQQESLPQPSVNMQRELEKMEAPNTAMNSYAHTRKILDKQQLFI